MTPPPSAEQRDVARCETCRWWGAERAHDRDRPYGTCHAVPPTFLNARQVKLSDTLTVPYVDWPWTAFDDWCREHSPHHTEAGA